MERKIIIFILALFAIQCKLLKSKNDLATQLSIISTRTLLSLFHADPDQFQDYFEVMDKSMYDYLDIDLVKTKDGVWVNQNKDTFNGKKLVDNTFDDLCKGEGKDCPVKFEDLLDYAVKNKIVIFFEDKTSPADNLAEIAEIVKKHNALDLVYFSKGTYELLETGLKYFKNILLYDIWGDGCTKKQAETLYKEATSKGGKVILNTSINKNKYLTPEEVKELAEKGFLIEVGFNWTDGKEKDFLDFFKKYDIKYVNAIKIDGMTKNNYSHAFREVYGL